VGRPGKTFVCVCVCVYACQCVLRGLGEERPSDVGSPLQGAGVCVCKLVGLCTCVCGEGGGRQRESEPTV